MKTLDKFCQQCSVDNEAKGWITSERSFIEDVALMHTELSEAIEAFRRGSDPTMVEYDEVTNKPIGVAVELADALIRIFHSAGSRGIPLADAFAVKMAYNKTRTYKHGNKKA